MASPSYTVPLLASYLSSRGIRDKFYYLLGTLLKHYIARLGIYSNETRLGCGVNYFSNDRKSLRMTVSKQSLSGVFIFRYWA